MSSLTLLGTGTCQQEEQRRASSVLLQFDNHPILFDCGHGVFQRLLEAGIEHHKLEHIIISHFHPDHISDLVPLLQAGAWSQRNPRRRDLHLYGPQGLEALISGLFDLYGRESFVNQYYQILTHELKEGEFRISGRSFESRSLPPAGNRGLRFAYREKIYAITGDSYLHQQERKLLEGVDLGIIDAGHIEDEEIIELAIASQAGTLVCSHLYRDLNGEQLQQRAEAGGYRGKIIIGRDLMSFPL